MLRNIKKNRWEKVGFKGKSVKKCKKKSQSGLAVNDGINSILKEHSNYFVPALLWVSSLAFPTNVKETFY